MYTKTFFCIFTCAIDSCVYITTDLQEPQDLVHYFFREMLRVAMLGQSMKGALQLMADARVPVRVPVRKLAF